MKRIQNDHEYRADQGSHVINFFSILTCAWFRLGAFFVGEFTEKLIKDDVINKAVDTFNNYMRDAHKQARD